MAKSVSSHDPVVTANAAGGTAAIVYVVCALLFAAMPDFVTQISNAWFHSISISQIDGRTVTIGSFLLGFISATVTAWIVGYLFATLYTGFSKR